MSILSAETYARSPHPKIVILADSEVFVKAVQSDKGSALDDSGNDTYHAIEKEA